MSKPQSILDAIHLRPLVQTDQGALVNAEHETFVDPWSAEIFEPFLHSGMEIYDTKYYGMRLSVYGNAAKSPTFAGYILFSTRRHHVHIANIAVRPPFHGQKLGHVLMAIPCGYAAARNIPIVYLEVRVSNTPAIGLYKKWDFIVYETRPNYYEDGEDAHIMAAYPGEPGTTRKWRKLLPAFCPVPGPHVMIPWRPAWTAD